MSTPPGDPDRSGDDSRPQEGPPTPSEPQTQPLGYWEQQQAAGQAQQPPPPGPPGPPGQTGYGYPAQYPVYATPDHPKATTALVLGLVGIIGGLTCYLPLALGPWAWSIGRRAVREIDAEPQRFGGRGQAMAGYVLGVISTVLLVLGILAALVFLVLAIALAGTSGPVGGIRA